MVTAERTPVSPADRILRDRFADELKKLIAGRPLTETVALLAAINNAMRTAREEAAAEPTRH